MLSLTTHHRNDMAISATYYDCPECRGRGTLVVEIDKGTGRVVHKGCSDCRVILSDDQPSLFDGDDGDGTTTYPSPLGGPWWRLSNGRKVRGEGAARDAQEVLDATA